MGQDLKLIKAESMLAGDDLEKVNQWGVLIDGDRIKEVGPAIKLREQAPEARVENYETGCIIPGMIDCHNHLAWDCSLENFPARMEDTQTELTVTGIHSMERDLRSGVTTSRYMGDRYHMDTIFKRLVAEGQLEGPKILASGIGMRASAGSGYVGQPYDGVEELTKAIRANILKGADWIKFYATGTFLHNGKPDSFYTKREIETIMEIAHGCGCRVTSHCIGGKGLMNAVAAGIDCLEHVYYITDEEIEAVLDAGIWVCLTMSEYFTEKPQMPTGLKRKYESGSSLVREHMKNLMRYPVPYVLGTDGMHGELAKEAQYAVEMGAPVRQAVQALTITAAGFLGLQDTIGSIAKGKSADLAVVRGNPYEDIKSLQNIQAVYQNGRRIC